MFDALQSYLHSRQRTRLINPSQKAPVSRRVLIADDKERIRHILRPLIEELAGVEVCALTRDGLETIKVAMALKPDLLILDVMMPGLNGIEVATVIKKSLPASRTVLFTMYDDVIRTLAPVVGVNAVLAKSDGISGLIRAVRSLLSDNFKLVEDSLTRAAQDCRINSDHLECLTNQLAVPLTRCSRDLKYLWVNRYYADWLQKPVGEIIGRSIIDVLGKEAFDSLRLRFDQVLTGEPVVYQANVNYDKIGLQRITAAYKPILRHDGDPDGWLAFVQNVPDSADKQAA